jgi:hypothetical protein
VSAIPVDAINGGIKGIHKLRYLSVFIVLPGGKSGFSNPNLRLPCNWVAISASKVAVANRKLVLKNPDSYQFLMTIQAISAIFAINYSGCISRKIESSSSAFKITIK